MKEKKIIKRNLEREMMNYIVALVVVLLVGGVFGVLRFREMQRQQQAYNDGQEMILRLQSTSNKVSTTFNDLNTQLKNKNSTVLQTMESAFPGNENYTDLAREIDEYFLRNNTAATPIFLSDLRFNQARYDNAKDYAILPFNMTITASRKSFNNFLSFIENSGDLTSKSRLMDITSISMSFDKAPTVTTATDATTVSADPNDEKLNVSMAFNAYFQKKTPTQTASA